MKEETVRTIDGSIDRINYDSAKKTANVIVITPSYITKAIYFWEYTGKGWRPYNPKDKRHGAIDENHPLIDFYSYFFFHFRPS